MTILDAGFSIERLTLPNEDAAEHRRLYDEWMAAYPCRGPIERGFVQQAVVALMEKCRIERSPHHGADRAGADGRPGL